MGKTVNSFRKHDVVGEIAKSLVAKWKKLVPQSADRYVHTPAKEPPSVSCGVSAATVHLCLRPNSYAKESNAQPRGLEAGEHRRPQEPSPKEEPSYVEEEEEERSCHTGYSPSPPRHEQYSPPQHGRYQSDEYDSPEPSPPPPPPPKEVPPAKPSREPTKNHHHHIERSRGRGEERRKRHAQTKKHSADRDRQQSPGHKAPKHKRDDRKKGDDGECVALAQVHQLYILSHLPNNGNNT